MGWVLKIQHNQRSKEQRDETQYKIDDINVELCLFKISNGYFPQKFRTCAFGHAWANFSLFGNKQSSMVNGLCKEIVTIREYGL